MSAALDFGSLNDHMAKNTAAQNLERSIDDDFRAYDRDVREGGQVVDLLRSPGAATARNLMRSAGPISDAYILSAAPMSLIVGPGGSGKTTASAKKVLVEAQRIFPGADRVRRYVPGVWRQKYVNLWKATIPSWWSIFPKDLGHWTGAPPRDAMHVIEFEDRHGIISITAHFRAFGEAMDPDDVLGNQYTDCYLNEWSTLPEELQIALADRVGRDPPAEVIRRPGRMYGDSNAPDVLNYCYRDFYEDPKQGYVLFRQPGGLDPQAENIAAMGRGYYENSARVNAHRPWWVKRMVHAKPGFTRDNNPVYGKWDDDRNMSPAALDVIRELPVLVGIDGGATPAAVYMQERADGQLRILAEIGLRRAGMRELATAMLALEAARFADCEFEDRCDPAMTAGEDKTDLGDVVPMEEAQISEGSDRQRLSKHLGREVKPARTQEVGARIDAIGCKLDLTCENGQPGLLVDPSCKGLRRGFNQTYHWREVGGSDDIGSVAKTFDGHRMEAGQYAALECGSAVARRLVSARRRERQDARDRARGAKRFSPFEYRRKRG